MLFVIFCEECACGCVCVCFFIKNFEPSTTRFNLASVVVVKCKLSLYSFVCALCIQLRMVWQLYKVANHIFFQSRKRQIKHRINHCHFFGLEIWWIFLLTLFFSIALPSIFVRLVFLCVRHSSPFYLFINVIITTCLQFMFYTLHTGDKCATHKHSDHNSVNRQCKNHKIEICTLCTGQCTQLTHLTIDWLL